MAVDDAHVHVSCDQCGNEGDPITLTALAGHRCWDERNVDAQLRRAGWTIELDQYICDSCTEEAKERHATGCICADCSGAELTAEND